MKKALVIALIALCALPATASAATWTRANTTPIGPIGPNAGAALPYPSTILVEDLPGTVTDVDATLVGLRHGQGTDVDVALIGPNGADTILTSDRCNSFAFPGGGDFTFDDSAATEIGAVVGDCAAGTYRPGNSPLVDDPFPGGPVPPYGSTMSALAGGSPNGNWSLFVLDDQNLGNGDILGGWRLTVTTDAAGASCRGQAGTILGTDGSDDLVGTDGDDVIVGLNGRDEIRGLGGNDLICGGDANDKIVGGPGKDRLLGERGSDRLLGGGGKDRLQGGPDKDILRGGKGKDALKGGGGKDNERE